ncbi:PadR family transcriptional regulator [Actinocrispum wychmicini]|uniref:PadR family transcriptional regulator n=1 Tax=Actinocrispum wychmicini TaxID=1213861 RepID=A0A4V2S902_9PSEU|nr:PadR family transcriptional regulator [Actinocrispum wychmicini]TCO65910.1 PadR family transcriptional regulator [Actinocrispum wychmicini]
MNGTRLFILGALAKDGPMHGHQIRRAAQQDRTELWTDIKPGSLYGALHRMAADGVVEVVRTEQEGNMPPRTVYAITPEGWEELAEHRDEALGTVRIPPDPVDLALQYTQGLSTAEVRRLMTARRDEIAERLRAWRELQQQAAPYLTGYEPLTFEHTLFRFEAELAWHDRFLDNMGDGP